tara:strand:+ start:358 stop:921 length:564 start_codon:yes stop_codon:yes gene_type:complete
MECSVRINDELIKAHIRPEYSRSIFYFWNLESSSLSESQVREDGPHISLFLSPGEFVSLATTGTWPKEDQITPLRIFGQISEREGRSACEYGSIIRYIDSVDFNSSFDGESLSIAIHGSTLPPELYTSRSPRERALLSRTNFSIKITMPPEEIGAFIKDLTTRESLMRSLHAQRKKGADLFFDRRAQ